MKKDKSIWKSLLVGLAVALVIIVYAYGFQVTKVDFEETRSEKRLEQLSRIIRALAHPNILEYEKEEVIVEAPVYLPCPDGVVDYPEPDTSGPYLVLDPYCNAAKEFILVSGHNFLPGTKGPINFIPPSGASLIMGNFEVDSEGNFEERVQLPKRQPLEEAQIIRAIARRNVGTPSFSSVAKATLDKIIETVFLALLATTFGTLIAIPLSFLAARNLMSDVKSPLMSVSLMILGWLIGMGLGYLATRYVRMLNELLVDNTLLMIGGLVLGVVVAVFAVRWAVSTEEEEGGPSLGLRAARILAMVIAALGIIMVTYLLADLLFLLGQYLMDVLGPFKFIGFFIAQTGAAINIVTPLLAALAGGAVIGGILSQFGLVLSGRLSMGAAKVVNFVLAAITGATLLAIFGVLIEWLYQIGNLVETFLIPAAIGAVLGGLLSLRVGPKDLLPIGTVIYTIMRTLLNAIRAIEPLIYVIIFVVWVGIGPFAGALALALHTIAALAKLYSEQVESISSGPLEAVTATGATRIQTIVYAVVPQIVPPYISFTMYRWDINVRMSTIIGFAGGGGIGFLLQQNIRLLDYRAAAVQMLAIAIVVASMDYISSALRKRFV
ncbi:MAG: ABC transporter permease subunit [Chloroflexota bacterium]|nr:ABC transporter permease subunit [Chloroflexota bacterium]